MKKQTFIIATIAVAIFMAACTDEDAKPSNSVTPDNGNEEPEEIDWEDPQTGQTASVFVDNVKFDMVYVEKGTFRQLIPYYRTGQFGIRVLDTVLMEERTIEESFLIGKFEVTQRQWLSVSTYNPSEDQSDPDLPVTNIHQTQMSRFIDTLNAITGLEFRMPNFLEWQYAAKGGNHSLHFLYAGSNNIDEVAWYSANSGGRPHRVGQLRPNELGLYDMCGNVSEHTSSSPTRGGSFMTELTPEVSYNDDLKVEYWYDNSPRTVMVTHDKTIGFRIAMAVPTQEQWNRYLNSKKK